MLITRLTYLIVFISNIYCALQFMFLPEQFFSSYQLSGPGATSAIQGLGVAFLMWNATYPLFIIRPSKYSFLGIVIIAQQIIGLLGESCILSKLDSQMQTILFESIVRFIVFDACGLVLLLIGYTTLVQKNKKGT